MKKGEKETGEEAPHLRFLFIECLQNKYSRSRVDDGLLMEREYESLCWVGKE